MSRRLFFALCPTRAVRQRLVKIAREVVPVDGRPVPPENFHVTLAFLGAVNVARRDCIEAAAAGIEASPFTLCFDHVGRFPRARVLWSGVSETPPALRSLVTELGRGLAPCGFVMEERPFAAHLTLFRATGGQKKNIPHDPVEWVVTDFSLVESSTLLTGARYRVLRRWPLAATSF